MHTLLHVNYTSRLLNFIELVMFAHCVWPPWDQIDVRYNIFKNYTGTPLNISVIIKNIINIKYYYNNIILKYKYIFACVV